MTSSINSATIENFLAFKGEFKAEFCPGVNIIIGGNASGKTTLLKALYAACIGYEKGKSLDQVFNGYIMTKPDTYSLNVTINNSECKTITTEHRFESKKNYPKIKASYIPEKDILEHAKGLLPFIDQKQTGFGIVYKDALVAAQDIPTQKQSAMQKQVGEKIAAAVDCAPLIPSG